MTSLKTSIKTITYLSDTGCLEIQGASLLMINKFIQGFQEVLHILYNMFEILILLECPFRAEGQSLSQILKVIIGMALWNILKTLLRVMMFFLSIV